LASKHIFLRFAVVLIHIILAIYRVYDVAEQIFYEQVLLLLGFLLLGPFLLLASKERIMVRIHLGKLLLAWHLL